MTVAERSGPAPATPTPSIEERRRLDDATKRARLTVMRRWATGLLGFAAVVFAVSWSLESRYPWLAVVRATAEAAVVGGLADWFAVTAIFRHPLGIPIPHTAVIPNQKDRIGRVLGNFVQNHFLSRDVVTHELKRLQLGTRLAAWLDDEENAGRLARQLAGGLAQAVEALPEQEIRQLLRQSAAERIRDTRIAPLLGNALELVTTEQQHQMVFDETLKLLGRVISENSEVIRDRIRAETPWWLPGSFDNAVFKKIMSGLETLVEGIRTNPNHPLRIKVDAGLKNFIAKLRTSPELARQAEEWKGQLITNELVDELVASVWDAIRKTAAGYRADPDAAPPESLTRAFVAIGNSLSTDERVREQVDDFIIAQIAEVADRQRPEVAELFARVVAKWDPSVAAERLELAIGSDLQYIRINGTLVGGFVGLVLYLITTITH